MADFGGGDRHEPSKLNPIAAIASLAEIERAKFIRSDRIQGIQQADSVRGDRLPGKNELTAMVALNFRYSWCFPHPWQTQSQRITVKL